MNKDEAELLAQRIAESNGGVLAGGKVKQVTVEMQIHRAETNIDEDYGIVSGYDRNPIKNAQMQLGIWFRNKKRRLLANGNRINK